MSKRLAINLCGEYPDIRCGRITTAMNNVGWEHECISRAYPPQMQHVYKRIDWMPYRDMRGFKEALAKSDGELIHVHGELGSFWPVLARDERPTILNVHDLMCARPNAMLDTYEAEALEMADAHIWVSEEQRAFAGQMGLCIDKPYACITNYASSSYFIDKTRLPHIGGVCYEGSIGKRGSLEDRDFSPVADAIPLHIYPGGEPPDYGICHPAELEYSMLIQRLAQHDWGFAGYPIPSPSWMQSFPTKASEYWAAGIPIIAMNTPLLKPFCDEGMGIYLDNLQQVKSILNLDLKPYKKAVMANRQRYTTENNIAPVAELYEKLCK